LLTGVPPFRASSPGAIMSAHLTEPVPDPGELVPSLNTETRRLVMTSMAKEPDQRFITFEAFIKACDSALEIIHQRDGGSIRLLRKPLVRKEPLKRAHDQADRLPDEASRANVQHASGAVAVPPAPTKAETRTPAAGTPDRPPGASRADRAAVAEPARATEALRRLRTDKIRNRLQQVPTQTQAPKTPETRSSSRRDPLSDGDADRTYGMGMTPWVLLGFTVVAIIAVAVWKLLLHG
jgi:serine/threonine protein kinase